MSEAGPRPEKEHESCVRPEGIRAQPCLRAGVGFWKEILDCAQKGEDIGTRHSGAVIAARNGPAGERAGSGCAAWQAATGGTGARQGAAVSLCAASARAAAARRIQSRLSRPASRARQAVRLAGPSPFLIRDLSAARRSQDLFQRHSRQQAFRYQQEPMNMDIRSESQSPVVPARVMAEGKQITGNAVNIGYGYFLSVDHVVGKAGGGIAVLKYHGRDQDARVLDQQVLKPFDLALLQREKTPEDAPLPAATLSRLDRWEKLQVQGWLGNQEHLLQGLMDGHYTHLEGISTPLWRLPLERPVSGSLEGLSGSGVFQTGKLVGIVSQQPKPPAEAGSGHQTDSLYFISLENWPDLRWPEGQTAPVDFEDRLLSPWIGGQAYLDQRQILYGREPILSALQEALKRADRKGASSTGYLVLLGGPKRGKSAIMAELIRRYGRNNCLWLFAGKVGPHAAETALIKQIGYLLGYPAGGVPEAREDSPGAVLQEWLTRWTEKEQDRPLVMFVDALDELQDVRFLPSEMPRGLLVVVSLRHEPRRRQEVTRFRPCLGMINLDGLPDDLSEIPRLVHLTGVQESNANAIRQLWEHWQQQDGHPQLPPPLRAAIDAKGGFIVGFHAAYAKYLSSK